MRNSVNSWNIFGVVWNAVFFVFSTIMAVIYFNADKSGWVIYYGVLMAIFLGFFAHHVSKLINARR